MIYGDCERGRRDLEPGVGSGMLEGGLQGYGIGGGFSHSCDILGSQLDLQSAGSSPNLTYTKISARDAIRIL